MVLFLCHMKNTFEIAGTDVDHLVYIEGDENIDQYPIFLVSDS